MQEVFDITIQDNNDDDDLSLLTGGDVSDSNTANAQIAAAIRQAENPKLVAQTVKSVLDTTEELKEEKELHFRSSYESCDSFNQCGIKSGRFDEQRGHRKTD